MYKIPVYVITNECNITNRVISSLAFIASTQRNLISAASSENVATRRAVSCAFSFDIRNKIWKDSLSDSLFFPFDGEDTRTRLIFFWESLRIWGFFLL